MVTLPNIANLCIPFDGTQTYLYIYMYIQYICRTFIYLLDTIFIVTVDGRPAQFQRAVIGHHSKTLQSYKGDVWIHAKGPSLSNCFPDAHVWNIYLHLVYFLW